MRKEPLVELGVDEGLLKAIVPGVMEATPLLIVYDDWPYICSPPIPGPLFSVQARGAGDGAGAGAEPPSASSQVKVSVVLRVTVPVRVTLPLLFVMVV